MKYSTIDDIKARTRNTVDIKLKNGMVFKVRELSTAEIDRITKEQQKNQNPIKAAMDILETCCVEPALNAEAIAWIRNEWPISDFKELNEVLADKLGLKALTSETALEDAVKN